MKTSDAFTNNVLSAFILVQPKGQFKIYNVFYLLRFVTKRRTMISRNVYKLEFLHLLLRNCQIWQKSKAKLELNLLQGYSESIFQRKNYLYPAFQQNTDSKRCYGTNSLCIKTVSLGCALSVRHSCFYMCARVVYKLCTSNVSKLSENGFSPRQKNVHNLATCE